jgi:signal transduction histidine kinase
VDEINQIIELAFEAKDEIDALQKFSKEAEVNIFESFFTSGKNTGTGLGLASVKKIIELHGGTITARNRVNAEGVEFAIALQSQKL